MCIICKDFKARQITVKEAYAKAQQAAKTYEDRHSRMMADVLESAIRLGMPDSEVDDMLDLVGELTA